MSIKFRLTSNWVIINNSFKLFNLHRPFQRVSSLKNLHRSLGTYVKTPSESLESNYNYYPCRIEKGVFGLLHRAWPTGFKYHGLYGTNFGVSSAMRVKSLELLIKGDHIIPDIQQEINEKVCRVVRCLISSFDFNCVITDCNILTRKLLRVPVIHTKWSLTNLRFVDRQTESMRVLQLLLNRYEKIPLSVLGKTISSINLDCTDIDLTSIDQYDRILVIMGTNGYYASWLTSLLYEQLEDKEVLPTVLFMI